MTKNVKAWFTVSSVGTVTKTFGGERKKVINHGTLTIQVPLDADIKHFSMPHTRVEYMKDQFINSYMVLTRDEMVAIYKALGKALRLEEKGEII